MRPIPIASWWGRFLLYANLVGLLAGCGSTNPVDPDFTVNIPPEEVAIQAGLLDEASGIADSRTMKGNLWVEEDSGNPAQINLLSYQGKLVARLPLPGVQNRDWEDLAIGPGPQPGLSYLYLADIGDNAKTNAVNYIYRFEEPKTATEAIKQVDQIAFIYPDGPRDAETILLDPLTRDVWIVTKAEAKVRLYQLPYPQNTTQPTTASFQGELPLSLVTSGNISPDGTHILLKTYVGIFYWQRTGTASLAATLLNQSPRSLPYLIEPQGEAVAFDQTGTGFFTLSERGNASSVTLNYYKRR